MIKKIILITITFCLLFMVATSATKVNITDVFLDQNNISEWATESVENFYHNGFVSGDEEGKFNPQLNVTRAEFAKMLATSLILGNGSKITIEYNDVKSDDWFGEYVATVSCVMTGDGINFRPNDNITREEIAVIIDRVLELSGGLNFYYTDKNEVSPWADDAINNVTTKKIMLFYNDKFSPKQNCTREMAVVILDRISTLENTDATKINISDIVETSIFNLEKYMLQNVTYPEISSIGGEWAIIGFALNNANVNDDFYMQYTDKATQYITNEEASNIPYSNKITDVQRIALAMKAVGNDPREISEATNLIDYTWNKAEKMLNLPSNQQKLGDRQGLNELVYGLINIDLYKDYTYSNANISREEIIDLILEYKSEDGGFNSVKNSQIADVDYTSMVIYALAEYNIKYVEDAVKTLENLQSKSGGFGVKYNNNGEIIENSESISQVIMAFSSLNIDIHEYFANRGLKSPIEILLKYQKPDGSFSHIIGEESNQMATEQAYIALGAYINIFQ